MSLFDEPPLHDFPDRAFHQLLQDPGNLRNLLAALLPDLVDRFDFAQLEVVPPAFLTADWRRRESDLLFRLPFRPQATGEALPPVLICLLLGTGVEGLGGRARAGRSIAFDSYRSHRLPYRHAALADLPHAGGTGRRPGGVGGVCAAVGTVVLGGGGARDRGTAASLGRIFGGAGRSAGRGGRAG
jgi:hypothetical protein